MLNCDFRCCWCQYLAERCFPRNWCLSLNVSSWFYRHPKRSPFPFSCLYFNLGTTGTCYAMPSTSIGVVQSQRVLLRDPCICVERSEVLPPFFVCQSSIKGIPHSQRSGGADSRTHYLAWCHACFALVALVTRTVITSSVSIPFTSLAAHAFSALGKLALEAFQIVGSPATWTKLTCVNFDSFHCDSYHCWRYQKLAIFHSPWIDSYLLHSLRSLRCSYSSSMKLLPLLRTWLLSIVRRMRTLH